MISADYEKDFFENYNLIMYISMGLAGADFLASLLISKIYNVEVPHTNYVQEITERVALTADFFARYDKTIYGIGLGTLSAVCYAVEGYGSSEPTLHKAGGGVSQIRQKDYRFNILSPFRATRRFFDLLVASAVIPYATYSGMTLAVTPNQPSGKPLPEVVIIAAVLGSTMALRSLIFKYLEYNILEHKSHMLSLQNSPTYKVVRAETAAAGFELNYWEIVIALGFAITIKEKNIVASVTNPSFLALLIAPIPLGVFGAIDALAIYDKEIQQRQSRSLALQDTTHRGMTTVQAFKYYFFNPNIQFNDNALDSPQQVTRPMI
jgi:hypothetical protein